MVIWSMMLMVILIFWMLTCNLTYIYAENFSGDHLPSAQVLLFKEKSSRKHTPGQGRGKKKNHKLGA